MTQQTTQRAAQDPKCLATQETTQLIKKLADNQALTLGEYEQLLNAFAQLLASDPAAAESLTSHAASLASAVRKSIYGTDVYVRGLVEITNYCRNNCLYCGIRCGNTACERYRLTPEEILECCNYGYDLGLRTFVLQGGEDPRFTDDVLCELVRAIKAQHPGCAVTLSLGERTRESYQRLRDAGADRYLLRHETADPAHYAQLHPHTMTLESRMRCLQDLKAVGFQTGCGFMVGSPDQTSAVLAQDLHFIQEFRPAMCGIGPFIPHHQTPFAQEPAGSVELTCFLLSLIRLACPGVLLPATTALNTACENGRERGILAGANVVMPNLSPASVRGKYELYNGKRAFGAESAEHLRELESRMRAIGYQTVIGRGDARPY